MRASAIYHLITLRFKEDKQLNEKTLMGASRLEDLDLDDIVFSHTLSVIRNKKFMYKKNLCKYRFTKNILA